jgi:hypothetical protein
MGMTFGPGRLPSEMGQKRTWVNGSGDMSAFPLKADMPNFRADVH